MRTALTTCTVVFVSALLALIATAADKTAAKTASKDAPFEKIKALSGEWEVKDQGGEHGHHGGAITYKITAGGSAVLETLFGGTDHEMVTMYYMEGDQLALTHYCMLQNRPHMHAQKQSSPDKIVFECNDDHEDNAKIENEDHMHKATFNFVDADHLKTEWVLYKDGKPDSTHSFELVRKKPKKS